MTCEDQKQISLEDILITEKLSRRSPKTSDLQAENQALHTLAQQLVQSPQSMLKTLVGIARGLCQAGTAGVSLLEISSSGESIFRWVALAGELEQYEQRTTPGNFSACGVCLERRSPELYFYPERYFTYLQQIKPAIVEGLVIPLVIDKQPIGTVWILSHDEQHHFDSEDVRLMTSLANFTTAALQSSRARQAAVDAGQHESQAQIALREAHVQLESALVAGAVYTWRWNIKSDCVIVNAAFADLFAVDPALATTEGLPIKLFIDAMHEEDRLSVLPAINQAIKSGQRYAAQYRVRTASGEERWLSACGQVEYDAGGSAVSFPGALIDITELKLAEEALRRSEERYRTLFESIDDGFCIIEMLFDENNTPIDYRFLQTNPAFEKQTGIVQAVGKTARQILPNLEVQWYEIYGKVALTGESIRFENGSEVMNRWFEVYACRVGQPKNCKVALLFKNITERKRIEAEREQILQREQAARQAAETANRIKDEFLAVLSHELRSPLNPILGWSSMLRSGRLNAAKTAYALETIERNAKLQVQLIEDLLDVSRILRGKLSLNMAPINLASTITAAMETVQLAAQAKSISVEMVFEKEVGQILGDSARVQQIIWNLLTNAVKFTPDGGSVEIELNSIGAEAQIQVRDTGKGIDPDFLPHVFEYFRQADSTTTRAFGGLGLGLAIVHHLVELHGGTVRADSPGVGQGARFTVRLPLLKDENQRHLDESTSLSLIGSSSSLALVNLRVLLVDDDTDTRNLIAFVLEQSGALVTSATSAIEALQAFKQTNFDVLISDIGMPQMDGYMLMQQIRAIMRPQDREILAIALTAYAGEINQQQAIAVGFLRHVTKPIEPENLVKVIADLIKAQS
ncbi:ATP-binding protein [Nostoc sp. PA-18-2419]|uniref:ATP-binding protein n=1 Tax=Nostoc sp. PA-18-2419 TaxID=2575443 RepID=UPI001108030C|nr:ATP-binding protein [Nostoc sp. PA-18-2419]